MKDGTDCPVCSSSRTQPMRFHYHWRDRTWSWIRCRNCTHQFVSPPLEPDDQAAIYHDGYFDRDGDWVEHVWAKGYLEAEAELRTEAREVLAMLQPLPETILEIGCAGGFFLDEARKAGCYGRGIELNASMARHALGLGLDVTRGRIEDADLPRPFDAVVLMDVLEHLPDPLSVLLAARLTPGGRIFIRGPLANDPVARAKEWTRRALRVEKQLPGYPLDVQKFTLASLETLFSQVGARHFRWIGLTRNFGNLVARL